MLGLIAVTSGNQLPAALLPWALLPLVRHVPSARPSRTAARSALVVAAMGGINGMATIAVLVVPLIWLLTRLFHAHPLTRHDGPVSTLRAYTVTEVRELAERAGLRDYRLYKQL